MPTRKFKYDHKRGIMIEETPESEKAVCDEIHKSVKKYAEPLDFGRSKKRGNVSLWPRYSDFIGVNPDERQAAMEESKKLGVPTYFNEDGDAYFESRAHENRYIRATGQYHKNAGYGDVAPNNFVESTHSRKYNKSAIDKLREENHAKQRAIIKRILERQS